MLKGLFSCYTWHIDNSYLKYVTLNPLELDFDMLGYVL